MPCQVDDDGQSRNYYLAKASEATRLLCDVMNWIGNAKSHAFTCVPGLEEWWAKHEAEDRARREADARRVSQEQKKRDALAKLTPEERRLLGWK
jgi:hypothetical protein